jgi:hypothetical protein
MSVLCVEKAILAQLLAAAKAEASVATAIVELAPRAVQTAAIQTHCRMAVEQRLVDGLQLSQLALDSAALDNRECLHILDQVLVSFCHAKQSQQRLD